MKNIIKIGVLSSCIFSAGVGFAQTQAELELQYRGLLLQMIQALQAQISQVSGAGETSMLTTPLVLPEHTSCVMTYTGQTDIQSVQEELKRQGYSITKLDGKIGPETRAAITAFQTKAGITADGLIGNHTREMLARHAVRCIGDSQVSVASPTVPATVLPSVPENARCSLSYQGSQEITEIQAELKRQGYSITKLDGKIGPETRAAITAFQTKAGITADGLIGNELRAALARASVQCGTTGTDPVLPEPEVTPPTQTQPPQTAEPQEPVSTVGFRSDEILAAVRSTSISNDTAVFTFQLSSQSDEVIYIPGDASAFVMTPFNEAGTSVSTETLVPSIVSSSQKIIRADGKTFFMIRKGDTVSLRISVQPGSGVYYGQLVQLQYTTQNASTILNPAMQTYHFTGESWKTGLVTLHN